MKFTKLNFENAYLVFLAETALQTTTSCSTIIDMRKKMYLLSGNTILNKKFDEVLKQSKQINWDKLKWTNMCFKLLFQENAGVSSR